ncbi:hypothetical protein SLS62_005742 [Diatrype stigma]|uniref:Altered inheritance of mitochondria protein 21 n=1 Tax=Diatrype stigma TaxID=117547 RepID=A0AAN9YN93_9PEZI
MSRPSSVAPKDAASSKKHGSGPDITVQGDPDDENDIIHVEDSGHHKGYVNYGDEQSAHGQGADDGYVAPILAPDEVAKDPTPHELHPAVEPAPERRGSAFEMDGPKSRPTSRPASIYSPPEVQSTPLEDVKEYEPLFNDDEKSGKQPMTAERLKEFRQRFPSRDIWEDAPNSVHATAEVSTPDITEAPPKSQAPVTDIPPRENETPAQAFARRQEELAEKELVTPDSFLYRVQKPQSYVEHQSHIAKEMHARPGPAQRFPSRDVWEDTPDSLQFTTTVSGPQSGRDTPPEEEVNSEATGTTTSDKPAIPSRPKKQASGDEATSKPTIPERPIKHQVPPQSAPETKQSEPAAQPKPSIPARPAGGKIAALQAGFMSDLNKRLQLGPQAHKKEESPAAPDLTEEKEKKPLADARKSRARGPQRRAPTKPAVSSTDKSTPPPASSGKPVLTFSMTRTLFSIDEEGTITVEEEPMTSVDEEPKKTIQSTVHETEESKPEPPKSEDLAQEPEAVTEGSKDEDSVSQPPLSEKPDVETPHADTTSVPEADRETKTLVANTAGEPILEETLEKGPGDEVKEVENTQD